MYVLDGLFLFFLGYLLLCVVVLVLEVGEEGGVVVEELLNAGLDVKQLLLI